MFQIRKFKPADAQACWPLFHDTVRRVNCRDYTPEQVNAWAHAGIDPAPWLRRFEGHFAYVAEHAEAIVGFADLTIEGYLDRLFVSADHQRRGIASILLDAIELAAMEHNVRRIHTQSSITAKPFFISRGYVVLKEQIVDCRGVGLTNFVMERKIFIREGHSRSDQ
ncbi:MAG: GNAT family N-acetyltransferase [Aureliella sp.]